MNISRLFHTVRHLQPRQVWYRLWYPVKKRLYRPVNALPRHIAAAHNFPQVACTPLLVEKCFQPKENTFTFLNISHSFGEHIDWDYAGYGRLWTYNLNYFDWLQDESIAVADRLATIHQYINADPATGREPYPISLRGINWIRFLAVNNIKEEKINNSLYRHYHRLAAFPEYHIAANHLLENAFSLFFAAHYFNEEKWYRQAVVLLRQELDEQVLPDGGHYERNAMYHSILLARLLQCIELVQHSDRFPDDDLAGLLRQKARLMLGWLRAFVFADGSFAMMGDAAPGIAPLPETLFDFAQQLCIPVPVLQLRESGYRKIKGQDWELLINIGAIRPAYQPGHAHADTFSFCLQANGKPLITDTGIATYEAGEQRLLEKSTNAHNTIEIENHNSSDIWHGFRVGKRANVYVIEETDHSITAYHDGYRDMDVIHERTYRWNNQKIIIEDKIKSKKGRKALLHLHFHPDVSLRQTCENGWVANGIRLKSEQATDAQLQEYQFCAGFNKRINAQRLRLCAADRIAIVIEF